MNTNDIVAQIDEQISRLLQARNILSGIAFKGTAGGGITSGGAKLARRRMSAEGRARIAKAQEARWAKIKKAAQK
ncbi:MAG TPA: hypothetical protein VFE38_05050 [Edaphobacter sp.]|nr:hypothetical protein [Edaphobacter sp.]